MKQKDWLIIAMVVIVGGIFSLILSNLLISSPKNRSEKVEVVDVITDQFSTPDKKYFNESSFDPTRIIQIGDNGNTKPFNAAN